MRRPKSPAKSGPLTITLTVDGAFIDQLAEAICARLPLIAAQTAAVSEATMAAAGTGHDIMTIGDILSRFQIARSTFHLWRRDRGFPKPMQTGERSPRWSRSEVDDWAKSRP